MNNSIPSPALIGILAAAFAITFYNHVRSACQSDAKHVSIAARMVDGDRTDDLEERLCVLEEGIAVLARKN